MLTITRTNQQWTAQFSNGHLNNHKAQGHSDVDALRKLAADMAKWADCPMRVLMAATVDAIADDIMAGDARPIGPVNLAEYYYRNVV